MPFIQHAEYEVLAALALAAGVQNRTPAARFCTPT